MNRKRAWWVVAGAIALLSRLASAQLPVVFDENTYPTNPENTFGAFTFDDFSGPGAFTDGPNSLILDVTDFTGTNGIFGGVGVDYGTPPGTNNRNFNAADARVELNIKILPNNAATAIRSTYIDQDPGFPVPAEEYVYEFDLTAVPVDGLFHLLTKPVIGGELFHQNAFNFDAADDGINNPGLRQMQIQSVFGSTGRLNVEIDFLRIVAIPEPATVLTLALAALALAVAVRRRRAA
jgi:PEP-CTERM motif